MDIEDPANPSRRQFVLLRHTMLARSDRQSHWDLMLDLGEKLLTFELRELPLVIPPAVDQELLVTRLIDHRRLYLNYAGALAAGAHDIDRGSVAPVAMGWATCHASVDNDRVRCQLISDQLVADIEYRPCAVGEQTQLRIYRWQLAAENSPADY